MVAVGHGGAATARPAPAERRPPVVIVVFDEFPADTLIGPDGRIDAARYPNFAALARTSTWFRNGQTVYDSTFKAVPAILDARMPQPRDRAGRAQPPAEHLPPDGPARLRRGQGRVRHRGLPAADLPRRAHQAARRAQAARRRRPARRACTSGSGRSATGRGPTFYFHHALLPHEPWIYLPSGHQSRPSGNDPIEGINRPGGFHDPLLTDHNHLRHLLQVGYVDRQLGLIVRRMKRTGLFDRSLFIVVADHGIAFEVGVKERRQVTETNFEQVAAVPFFVKRARPDARAGSTTASCATSTSCRPWPTCSARRSGGGTTAARCSRRPPGRAIAWRCRGATSAA